MRDSSNRVPASWMAMAFPSTSLDTAEDEEEEATLLRLLLLLPPALILDGLMVSCVATIVCWFALQIMCFVRALFVRFSLLRTMTDDFSRVKIYRKTLPHCMVASSTSLRAITKCLERTDAMAFND